MPLFLTPPSLFGGPAQSETEATCEYQRAARRAGTFTTKLRRASVAGKRERPGLSGRGAFSTAYLRMPSWSMRVLYRP